MHILYFFATDAPMRFYHRRTVRLKYLVDLSDEVSLAFGRVSQIRVAFMASN